MHNWKQEAGRLILMVTLMCHCSTNEAAEPTVTPGTTTLNTITVDSRERTYRLRVPVAGASAPRPLVFCLHGGGSKAQEQETLSGFSAQAESVGCIVVYPDGVADPVSGKRNFNDGRLNTGYAFVQGVDDGAFMVTLLDAIAAVVMVDRQRVFACGVSNGGLMSQRLALDHSERFAAIGPVAANIADQLVPPIKSDAAPALPVAVCQISGVADAFMPYAGGMLTVFGIAQPDLGAVIGAEAAIDFWVQANGCVPAPVVTTGWGPTPDAGDGCTVERRDYAAGPSGASVTLLKIAGGGHTWPGSNFNPAVVGPVCRDFDATATLWSFFTAHPKTTPVLVRDVEVTPTANPQVVVLTISAEDDGGASGLTYSWTTSGPGGSTAVLSANHTAAASTIEATCAVDGTWQATVQVADADGASFTRTATFTITQPGGSGTGSSPSSSGSGGGCGSGVMVGALLALAALMCVGRLRPPGVV